MTEPICDIECAVLGEFQTNTYTVQPAGNDTTCWVFDPGMGAHTLLHRLTERKLSVERIVITHGHADHIAGAAELIEAYPQAVLTVPAGEEEMLSSPQANLSAPFGLTIVAPPAGALVKPGDQLRLGQTRWQVLDTAGHSPGGVSYYCRQAGVVIVGDALFAGSIGRCDLPGSDFDRLIANIRINLLSLPENTRVLPGHGPQTSIGAERENNPFLH
ncbi:MAG: MBL fold metallo-hydrolase [Planctomycetes bacterium]|nr:MBL fold metallo-hydrolase [Planctomycetota bacterium]